MNSILKLFTMMKGKLEEEVFLLYEDTIEYKSQWYRSEYLVPKDLSLHSKNSADEKSFHRRKHSKCS